jgi:hypothetical protein
MLGKSIKQVKVSLTTEPNKKRHPRNSPQKSGLFHKTKKKSGNSKFNIKKREPNNIEY